GGDPRRFRSLAAAVKYILEDGRGNVRFPDNQTVYIESDEDLVEVHHRTHPWGSAHSYPQEPGLQRVAQVIKRFRPDAEVSVWDEWSALERR
ncbi:hypothetical protein LCGC14_2815170, partial [marine sediment metagenome]